MEAPAAERDRQQLGTRIPVELHKRLKHASVDTGRSMTELVEEAIRDLLSKMEGDDG